MTDVQSYIEAARYLADHPPVECATCHETRHDAAMRSALGRFGCACPQPVFKVGDKVKAVSFTSCFNEFVPEVPGLVVAEVRMIAASSRRDSLKPYFRVTAADVHGFPRVEGAERYFELELANG
jgi:hypothetical protein